MLRVAPAAYYAWRHRRQLLVVEPGWHVAVREAFADHSQRTALGRLRAELQAQGHAVGRGRIRRVLRAHGLRAQQPRSFGPRPTPLYGPSPTGSGWALVTYLPRQGGGWKLAKVQADLAAGLSGHQTVTATGVSESSVQRYRRQVERRTPHTEGGRAIPRGASYTR